MWLSASGHKKAFVYVEMKHAAEHGEILTAQDASDLLHHGIANGVGVPNTLALDQFDALLLDRYPVQGFNDDFRHGVHGRPTWRRGLMLKGCDEIAISGGGRSFSISSLIVF